MKNYIEKRNGAYWVIGKRISLDSIVYLFRNGSSPESIHKSFSLLTLEEIYGAIAFYLANQKVIDEYLTKEEIKTEKMQAELNNKHSEWHKKLKKTKNELLTNQI